MKNEKLKEGDLVIAIGSTFNSSGVSEIHKTLASVIAVGKRDIFVSDEGSSVSRVFSIPRSRCIPIGPVDVNFNDKLLLPEISDLVIAIKDKYGNVEKKAGVLMEIIDIPGKTLMCQILHNENLETVIYSNLIVLEKGK